MVLFLSYQNDFIELKHLFSSISDTLIGLVYTLVNSIAAEVNTNGTIIQTGVIPC